MCCYRLLCRGVVVVVVVCGGGVNGLGVGELPMTSVQLTRFLVKPACSIPKQLLGHSLCI